MLKLMLLSTALHFSTKVTAVLETAQHLFDRAWLYKRVRISPSAPTYNILQRLGLWENALVDWIERGDHDGSDTLEDKEMLEVLKNEQIRLRRR